MTTTIEQQAPEIRVPDQTENLFDEHKQQLVSEGKLQVLAGLKDKEVLAEHKINMAAAELAQVLGTLIQNRVAEARVNPITDPIVVLDNNSSNMSEYHQKIWARATRQTVSHLGIDGFDISRLPTYTVTIGGKEHKVSELQLPTGEIVITCRSLLHQSVFLSPDSLLATE